MSFWSYVKGMIEVYPMGRTQAEKRYILETVLSHLPPVTGSEENMKAHIVQKSGFNFRMKSGNPRPFNDRDESVKSYI